MEKFEAIKESITTIRNGLQRRQKEMNALISHPVLVSWHQLDLQKNADNLTALGLSVPNIAKSISACQQGSQKFKQDASHLKNAVGNLQADLIGNFNEEEITKSAVENSANYETIKKDVGLVYSHVKSLINTKKQLLDHLHLNNLFNLAKKSVGGRGGSFDHGLKVFLLFFKENTNKSTNNILSEYIETATKLETRFGAIELPPLPRIAAEVIEHHISLGIHTANQISSFTNAIAGRFVSETGTRNLLNRQLEALKDEPEITTILHKTKIIAKSLGELILYLFNKKNLLERIPLIPETCEYLNTYHLFIKNSLLQQIPCQIETIPTINPTIVAANSTKPFFYGIKGMMRSFKLMYSSLKGKEAINETELQLILEEAINSCRIFYGDSREDVHCLKAFINNLIKQFTRPFPYNQLFKLTKKTIVNYGNQFESFILEQEIDEKYRQQKEPVIPKSFAKLVENIRQKDTIFTNFVSSLNK